MRPFLLAAFVLAAGELSGVQDWMQHAFYPALLLILVSASLGVPIPEDIPLIAAGVLLRTHPGIASWHGALAVALLGIMIGDLVLYSVGRSWGPGVVNHRWVCWMITPDRFARVSEQFRRHGAWCCFFGRFVMGVRAVMCLTAGATRFPGWRFFLADYAGALLSAPFFVVLGYVFAGVVPTLRAYVSGVQAVIFAGLVAVVVVAITAYWVRKRRLAQVGAGQRDFSPRQVTESVPVAPPGTEAGREMEREVASAESEVGAGV